jgi:malonyl CoA-acyl carrier protein transacylase
LTRPFAVSKIHTNGRVLILNDLFMKKLNLEQMEKIEGGSCGLSLGLLGVSMVAATFIAAPIVAAVWAVGFIGGAINTAQACS